MYLVNVWEYCSEKKGGWSRDQSVYSSSSVLIEDKPGLAWPEERERGVSQAQ